MPFEANGQREECTNLRPISHRFLSHCVGMLLVKFLLSTGGGGCLSLVNSFGWFGVNP